MAQNSSVNLKGAMNLIKKSKLYLAPIFEAITNSFEAIAHRTYSDNETPYIQLDFHYKGVGLFNTPEFEYISITDNGIGFTDEGFVRYKTLLDNSKGFNNRGSGRVQFLHRFSSVNVSSTYLKEGKINKRSFISSTNDLASGIQESVHDNDEIKTSITLTGIFGDKPELDFYNALSKEEIKNAIRKKFLLKFYLEQEQPGYTVPTIRINFHIPGKEIETIELSSKDVPQPQSTGQLTVPYLKAEDHNGDIEWKATTEEESLNWAYFKLPDQELDQNAVFLCSKDVAIQEVPFLKIKKNESFQGNRYMTLVYGDVLNAAENVNDSVDKFTFPSQKDTEKELKDSLFPSEDEKYLFIETIENSVKKSLPEAYKEIEDLKTEQTNKASELAAKHGIPEELAHQIKIEISDTEDKITEKLYKKQAEDLAKENIKIEHLFTSLKELNPTTADYQIKLEEKGKELLELIPQQNKQELSRYVIRREMVTTILKLVLDNGLDYQNEDKKREDREGLIHDLVFKRKSTDTDGLNDLWILNEEYLHFDGCSDLPINQIETSDGTKMLDGINDDILDKFGINRTTRRPDIFLFVEEGKCVLVEFKAHDVDLSDHLNQLTKYCNLIANCSKKKLDQFYCYLIGENISRVDLPGDFRRSVNGDYVKPTQPILSVEDGKEELAIAYMYQEVIQLSAIHKRAFVRNKSFADKLGLRLQANERQSRPETTEL